MMPPQFTPNPMGIIGPGEPGYGRPPGPSFPISEDFIRSLALRRRQALNSALTGAPVPGFGGTPVDSGFPSAFPDAPAPGPGSDGGFATATPQDPFKPGAPSFPGADPLAQGIIDSNPAIHTERRNSGQAWGPRGWRQPILGRNRGMGAYRDPTGILTYKATAPWRQTGRGPGV